MIPKQKVDILQPNLIVLQEVYNDFENVIKESIPSISSEKSFSGKNSFKLLPTITYGAEVIKSFSEIPVLNDLRQIEVSFKNWNITIEEGTSWVLELNDRDGNVIGWYSEFLPVTLNNWESCFFHFNIKTEFLNKSNRIKTYVWNKNKSTCYIDDLRIRFLGINKEINNTIFNPLNQSSFFFDLETNSSLEMTESLTDKKSYSGKYSSYVSGKNEYSVMICKNLSQVMNDTIQTIGASVWLYPLNNNPECTFVFEVRNSQNEQIYWNGKSTAKMNLKTKSWQKINASFNLAPEDYRKFGPDDRLCIYLFNNNNSKVYADDFEISYGTIPEQRGSQNYVDMNSLEPDSYNYNRHHPPFRISLLQRENIHNENSQFLIKDDSIQLGNFRPNQFITTGIFTGIADGKDEILILSDNMLELYYYCSDIMRFILCGKHSFDSKILLTNSTFLTGDFDGNKKSDLIITTGTESYLYSFTADPKLKCKNGLSGVSAKLLWSGNLFNKNIKTISGNFSGNSYNEILCVDTKGYCILKKFNGKEWTELCNKFLPPSVFSKSSTQVCGKFFSATKDVVISANHENNKTTCTLLELINNKIVFKNMGDGEKPSCLFNVDEILYPVKIRGKKHEEILVFKNQWRFELKLISSDSKGFYVSSVPEFTNYIFDQNPKYYEFPMFVPGKFTGHETQLLCILRNCADNNFNGKNCNVYDSIPDLPNTIQLYNFYNEN